MGGVLQRSHNGVFCSALVGSCFDVFYMCALVLCSRITLSESVLKSSYTHLYYI